MEAQARIGLADRLASRPTHRPFTARAKLRIMQKMFLAVAFALTAFSAGSVASARAGYQEPLDAKTLKTIEAQFSQLMALANKHDLKALHGMYWQSPSALLVAKSAIPSEGWAGVWGNDAIDQKLHDIAGSGPVVLTPDFSKFKAVGLNRELAESYAPVTITVSYAGQSGTPKPFLIIVNWMRVEKDWKIASEIILPVPPAPAAKG